MKKSEETNQPDQKPGRTLPGAAKLVPDSAGNARPVGYASGDGSVGPASARSHGAKSIFPPTPESPPEREKSHTDFLTRTQWWASAALPQIDRSSPVRESPAALAASATASVEQLANRVLEAVAELRRLQPDSMSVLIKPDPHTELHLHLQLQNGAVEIEAKVQRGDFPGLSLQWAQLQQNLATQGIRLSGLQDTVPPSLATPEWTGGSSHQRREQETPPGHSEAAPLMPPNVIAEENPSPDRPRSRTWESWA
jgi:hypothetical protein